MANKNVKDTIKDKYLIIPTAVLALELGMKIDTVRKIANRMGLKRRKIVANDIVNGMKKCSICGELLPLSHFSHDRYQPNDYDYRCKTCKKNATLLKPKEIISCPEDSLEGIDACSQDRQNNTNSQGCMAFGVDKKRIPVIDILDESGNTVKGKRCKVCGIPKPLTAFGFTDKRKTKTRHICKKCYEERRIQNKKLGILKMGSV